MTLVHRADLVDAPSWSIRPELPVDLDQIHELHREAFRGPTEQSSSMRSEPARTSSRGSRWSRSRATGACWGTCWSAELVSSRIQPAVRGAMPWLSHRSRCCRRTQDAGSVRPSCMRPSRLPTGATRPSSPSSDRRASIGGSASAPPRRPGGLSVRRRWRRVPGAPDRRASWTREASSIRRCSRQAPAPSLRHPVRCCHRRVRCCPTRSGSAYPRPPPWSSVAVGIGVAGHGVQGSEWCSASAKGKPMGSAKASGSGSGLERRTDDLGRRRRRADVGSGPIGQVP